ncbi:class I SAM-dependent methyltransferase [Corynebacterium sp. AOP40-9SA-29]|uniref:class I SAM-dependent methyltransferase n=1 Tax=Corynebacterium sp. AOP40-9SA-29 TaxID=3457677 RepID=UPI004033BD81
MLPWDHNSFYHRLLMKHLPTGCGQVLDVGCGSGAFAARLAERADRVDAIDRSPTMIDRAQRRVPDNVTCNLADVLESPPLPDSYDAIFSISTLHHMNLTDALPVLADALRPGGTLAAIALPKTDLRREWPIELAATVTHHALGGFFYARKLLGYQNTYPTGPAEDSMPMVLAPPLTTRDVRSTAGALLPGCRVRRLLFWRYLLTWQKPL